MKRKIFNVLFALVLLLGMSLVMAAPAAATTVTEPAVTLTAYKVGVAGDYSIVFTTHTAMASGDTITIVFPTLTDLTTGPYTDAHVTVDDGASVTVTSSAVQGGRVNIVLGDTCDAHAVTVAFTTAANVLNPATVGSYTLQVYTSKEEVAVTSAEYKIYAKTTNTLGSPGTVVPTSAVAGATTVYTIPVKTSSADAALAAGNTLTFEFPTGTTVSGVTGVTFNAVTATFSVSSGNVTVTLPTGETLTTADKSVAISGVVNPITAAASTYTVKVKSNYETEWKTSTAYAIVAGAGARIALTAPTTFSLTPNVATTFTVKATDINGNLVTGVTPTILFSTNSTSGTWSTVSGAMSDGVINSNYTDTTAGTYTINIHATPQTTYTNTITQTIVVNPQAALYHAGTLVANYNTIQAAITAAVPGDTIIAGDGTYNESLTVDKPNLTLRSANGKAVTFIQNAGNVPSGQQTGFEIKTNGSGFKLGGAEGQGFTFKCGIGATPAPRLIQITHNIANIEISYNTIDTRNTAAYTALSTGINIGAAGTTSLTITHNTFIGDADATYQDWPIIDACTDTNKEMDITVTYNDFTGSGTPGKYGAAIALTNVQKTSLTASSISYNTISSFDRGIILDTSGTTVTSYVVINGNTISGCTEGIYLRATGGNLQNITIKQNALSTNVDGIRVRSDTNILPATLTIKYNDFTGNTAYGVLNQHATSVTAQYNYWGSATGPLATANPSGAGNAVSASVDYSPWLYNSQATVVATGKSQYAISVLLSNAATLSGGTYSGGWNTFSTPISLDSSADTWSEIKTLASATANVSSAYAWNGITWVTPSDITPLNAIFVQLTPGSSISLPILYGTTLLPAATKTMHAAAGSYTGWELIGPASLTADDFDGVALLSINTKYSQVINPITGAVLSGANTLAVGAGYWVFMTADGTLAGFSVTPFPFVAVP
jgi:hypothetical protein